MIPRRWPFVAALLAVGTLSAGESWAAGAVAAGVPESVARDGVAQGLAVGYETAAEASEIALDECRTVEAPEATRALCKVVATFAGRCAALATDPKPGTPGFGWGLGDTKAAAEKAALDSCRASAGWGRQRACRADAAECDR